MGRDEELGQLHRALAHVPVAVIYGVPGVGKTTLALAYGEAWPGPAVHVPLTAGKSLQLAMYLVRRRLRIGGHCPSLDDEERVDELWRAIDRVAALVVLDDVHNLPPETRALIVDSAGQTLRRGRLVAVSRELIPVSPDRPDRMHLKLEGLDRAGALELWERLQELYGPASDFDAAWRVSHGNPFLLRQAHVATPGDASPLVGIVRTLDEDERLVAGALALSLVPLPSETLSRFAQTVPVKALLNRLVTRLIVDVTPDARFAMHDLMRDAIVGELDGHTTAEIRAGLLVALRGAGLDSSTLVQETARHLRALDRHRDVAQLLIDHSADLNRQGANDALLQEINALPPAVVSPEIRLLRAQTLARNMRVRQAYEELKRLVEHDPVPPRWKYLFATLALLAGELDPAEGVLGALRDQATLSAELRAKAELGLAWAHLYRGRMTEALAIVDRIECLSSEESSSRGRILRQFALYLWDRHREAADLAAGVVDALDAEPRGLWCRWLTPVICAAVLAGVGRFEEAERAVGVLERTLRHREGNLELGWVRMAIRYERGERAAALEYFLCQQRLADRGGHFMAAIWTRSFIGKLLLLLGRRRQALELLSESTAKCRAQDAGGLQRLVEASLAEDPLCPGWLSRSVTVSPSKVSDHVRADVRAVLSRVCSNARPPHPAELAQVEVPDSADYAFDRALLHLARALLASRRAQGRVATRYLQLAIDEAALCQADRDLVPTLYERCRSSIADELGQVVEAPRTAAFVIDGELHEVRDGSQRVCLATHLILRRLVYAFAAAPGRHLDRDTITRALWGTDYDPLRHESSLKSNVRRLRELLGVTRAVIQSDGEGYRLVVPDGATFVAPSDAR